VLWGRREESGVEEERTRERKNAACLVELETHWCAALSLSSGGNMGGKTEEGKIRKFKGCSGEI
jgi:hypothetical protein